jgi:hypothetical protein
MSLYLCNKKHYKVVRLSVYRDSHLTAGMEQVPKLLFPSRNKKNHYLFFISLVLCKKNSSRRILWLVDPLPGNDRERSYYRTAVTKQRLLKQVTIGCNIRGSAVFSTRSVPRCYKQDKWSVISQ